MLLPAYGGWNAMFEFISAMTNVANDLDPLESTINQNLR